VSFVNGFYKCTTFIRQIIFNLTVVVNAWVNAHGFTDAKYALQEKIISELKQGGIKLPGM
jgi:hypothetical protein